MLGSPDVQAKPDVSKSLEDYRPNYEDSVLSPSNRAIFLNQDREALVSRADYRRRANEGLAAAALLMLTPFAINNFIQGRILLGFGSAAIVIVMAANAWILKGNRLSTLLNSIVVVPAMLIFISMSIQHQGVIGVMWSYPAVLACFIILPERNAMLAAGIMVLVLSPQVWLVLGPGIGIRSAATLTAIAVFTAIFVRSIVEAQERLQEFAITDSLTGLNNRVMLGVSLNRAVQQYLRSDTPMALLAIDIDHFKSVNDELGHAVGDLVLSGVGNLLKNRFRQVDQIFRSGGEEFLVLLNDTGRAESLQIAENLREMIEERRFLETRPITVSIGVASLDKTDTVETWMKRADASLYRAKTEGRNRVVASEPETVVA